MEAKFDLQDSETDEALSLCDLQINEVSESKDYSNEDQIPSSDQSDQELFEFSSEMNVQNFPTEDIIFCGKILAYKESASISDQIINEDTKPSSFRRLRSESLDELRRSRTSAKERLLRSSHSLDYRTLDRLSNSKISSSPAPAPAPEMENDQIMSGKCFGKRDRSRRITVPSSSHAKPKWHLLMMFGSVKFPPEMKLRDIKNRQSRRNPASLFPSFDSEETVSVKRDEVKSSWRLLRALSCKGHANAVVTASLAFVPHV